jgi:hypothetical protein
VNFAVIGYAYSWGEVIFDPSLPVTDVQAKVNGVSVGYGRTIRIGKMQGLITVAVPYAWGTLSGVVGGTIDSTIHRSGFADLRAKFSLNLLGSPALTPKEFATTPAHRFILGASIAVVAPTGEYVPEHLINVGSNRWAYKPELGVSYNWNRKLYLDFYAGVWLFGDAEDFYPGSNTKSQDPLTSLQLHVSYTFSKKLWAAFESTWYSGGDTHVNGGPAKGRQDNRRVGLLASYAITPKQALKLNYIIGATARVGSKFQSIGVAYQVLWF